MDAKSEQVNHSIPSTFNLGEPVVADFDGNKRYYNVAVICPNFGNDESYTKVNGLTRLYHVQSLSKSIVKKAWLPLSQLKPLSDEIMMDESRAFFLKECQKVIGKTKEEQETDFQNPFEFERPLKKIKQEDQSEEFEDIVCYPVSKI